MAPSLREENQQIFIASAKLEKFIINEADRAQWIDFCLDACKTSDNAQKLLKLVSGLNELDIQPYWLNTMFAGKIKANKDNALDLLEMYKSDNSVMSGWVADRFLESTGSKLTSIDQFISSFIPTLPAAQAATATSAYTPPAVHAALIRLKLSQIEYEKAGGEDKPSQSVFWQPTLPQIGDDEQDRTSPSFTANLNTWIDIGRFSFYMINTYIGKPVRNVFKALSNATDRSTTAEEFQEKSAKIQQLAKESKGFSQVTQQLQNLHVQAALIKDKANDNLKLKSEPKKLTEEIKQAKIRGKHTAEYHDLLNLQKAKLENI